MVVREKAHLEEPEENWLVLVIFSVFWILPLVKAPEEEEEVIVPEVKEERCCLHSAEAVEIQIPQGEEEESLWAPVVENRSQPVVEDQMEVEHPGEEGVRNQAVEAGDWIPEEESPAVEMGYSAAVLSQPVGKEVVRNQ